MRIRDNIQDLPASLQTPLLLTVRQAAAALSLGKSKVCEATRTVEEIPGEGTRRECLR